MTRTPVSNTQGSVRCDQSASVPAVAVIVPCYNGQATLAAALGSACVQDVDQEIIVIDDGSTDRSRQIASSFAPYVRLVTGPNRGVSVARNRGIAETRAPWIVFLDADDELTAGALKSRLATAAETGADVVISDWEEISCIPGQPPRCDKRAFDWEAFSNDGEMALATDAWATTAAIMYGREIVERVGGFRNDLPVIQDARFLFDAVSYGARVARLKEVGARYNVLANSLSRSDPTRFWRDVLVNAGQIEAIWSGRGALTPTRRRALAGVYNTAARGLFSNGHGDYFKAIEAQRRVAVRFSKHGRVAPYLARMLGLAGARRALALIGKA